MRSGWLAPGPPFDGGNVLDEKYDVGQLVEDEDCGCWVVTAVVDGRELVAHHWIPDDTAPHVPDPECGCEPTAHTAGPGELVRYEHRDQDAEDRRGD